MAQRDNTALYVTGGVLGLAALLWLTSQTEPGKKIIETITPPFPGDLPKTPTEFITRYRLDALQTQAATGVPARLTLAQAGLESAYGKSAPGFNFFGVKAGSSWPGETQKLLTWECGKTGDPKKDGIRDEIVKILPPGAGPCGKLYSYRVYGKFRKYKTAAEGFEDHGNFLRVNKRYRKAFDYTGDPVQFAREIARAGYATAPNYEQVLTSVVQKMATLV